MIGGHTHVGRPGLGHFGQKMIKELTSRMMARMNKTATGMTLGTGLNLGNIGAVQVSQTEIRVFAPPRSGTGKINMVLSGTVTGFTGHINF